MKKTLYFVLRQCQEAYIIYALQLAKYHSKYYNILSVCASIVEPCDFADRITESSQNIKLTLWECHDEILNMCLWNIKLQKGYLNMKSAYSAIYVRMNGINILLYSRMHFLCYFILNAFFHVFNCNRSTLFAKKIKGIV